jgi:hypothetical protein
MPTNAYVRDHIVKDAHTQQQQPSTYSLVRTGDYTGMQLQEEHFAVRQPAFAAGKVPAMCE